MKMLFVAAWMHEFFFPPNEHVSVQDLNFSKYWKLFNYNYNEIVTISNVTKREKLVMMVHEMESIINAHRLCIYTQLR